MAFRNYADLTLIGIILAVIVILIILAMILKFLFPKSKISEKMEEIAEWISDNIRF